jgi:hypothetical protein
LRAARTSRTGLFCWKTMQFLLNSLIRSGG